MGTMKREERRKIILDLYSRFHHASFLEWDPLSVIREFHGKPDQEYVALVSALFAFGGVKQIIASVRHAVGRIGLSENPGITRRDPESLNRCLSGFRHRIYIDQDLVQLTLLYQRSCQRFGGLKEHFLMHHEPADPTIERGLTGLIRDYRQWSDQLDRRPGAHFSHMLNSPEGGSTCKRWLMFLKWMVRPDDGIDLGLWSGSPALRTDQLLIPLDTHLFKISRKLGLTRKKTANWMTALEVTKKLKDLDPNDPTRFDFALCRFGMLDYRGLSGYARTR
jgi:uncharacterized protein (TIGR02757 family)